MAGRISAVFGRRSGLAPLIYGVLAAIATAAVCVAILTQQEVGNRKTIAEGLVRVAAVSTSLGAWAGDDATGDFLAKDMLPRFLEASEVRKPGEDGDAAADADEATDRDKTRRHRRIAHLLIFSTGKAKAPLFPLAWCGGPLGSPPQCGGKGDVGPLPTDEARTVWRAAVASWTAGRAHAAEAADTLGELDIAAVAPIWWPGNVEDPEPRYVGMAVAATVAPAWADILFGERWPLILLLAVVIFGLAYAVAERARQLADERDKLHGAQRSLEGVNADLQASVAKEAEARAELEQTNGDLVLTARKAEEANRAKSIFLAQMNHEIRNPLNAIIQRAEYLQEISEEDDLEEYNEETTAIVSRSRHLLEVINKVLDMSQIEAGRIEPEFHRREIGVLVEELKELAEPLVQKTGNAFVIEADGEALGDMVTDVTRARQCILNLVSNSAKFTSDGEVRLAVTLKDNAQATELLGQRAGTVAEWVSFKVVDTGIGMTPEELARIFEPFTQANEGISAKYGGTGLGLSLTQELCQLLGGDIFMWSEKGVGTTAEMLLPRYNAAGVSKSAPQPVDVRKKVKRVLVVDDDEAFHGQIEKMLGSFAVELLHARTVESGMTLCRSARPDVVVLDILMPVHDGWRFLSLKRQEAELEDIPVLIVTGTEYDGRAEELGATSFFSKPLDAERKDQFLHMVTKLLGGREVRRVLIVDDEFETRRNLRRSFADRGAEVSEAENGVIALETLIAEPTPDLIIMDLVMPEMDGFETISRIRASEEWHDVPIVVLTSKDLTRTERENLSQTTDGLLDKSTVALKDVASLVARITDTADTAA